MRSDGQNKTSLKVVVLNGAKITGQLAMTGATFDGELDAGPAGFLGGPPLRHKTSNVKVEIAVFPADTIHALHLTYATKKPL